MPKSPLSEKTRFRYVIFNPCYGCENAILWLWDNMPRGQRQMLFRALRGFGSAAIDSNKGKAHANAAAFGQKWMLRPGNKGVITTSNTIRIALTILDTSERIREDISCGVARLATMNSKVLAEGLEKIQRKGNEVLRSAELLMLAQAAIQKELGITDEQSSSTAASTSLPTDTGSKVTASSQNSGRSARVRTHKASQGSDEHINAASQATGEHTQPTSSASMPSHPTEEHPQNEEQEVDWTSLAGFDNMAFEGE